MPWRELALETQGTRAWAATSERLVAVAWRILEASPLPAEGLLITPDEAGGAKRADVADRKTLERIFREALPRLWRALRLFGVADADVEDLCQETFIVALRRIDTFEGRSALTTWLYGIAVHVAMDHRRKAHVRREILTEAPEPSGDAPTPFDHAVQSELRGRLLAALDALDEARRTVFVLFEVEGLDMKAVAEAVGCPLQTAYSRLHSARKSVAEHFEDHATKGSGRAGGGAP